MSSDRHKDNSVTRRWIRRWNALSRPVHRSARPMRSLGQTAKVLYVDSRTPGRGLERAAGIEPASSAWKAEVLPLHNARALPGSRVSLSGRRMQEGQAQGVSVSTVPKAARPWPPPPRPSGRCWPVQTPTDRIASFSPPNAPEVIPSRQQVDDLKDTKADNPKRHSAAPAIQGLPGTGSRRGWMTMMVYQTMTDTLASAPKLRWRRAAPAPLPEPETSLR